MSTLNGQHYYYGNIKAQTDNWDRDTIGVSYNYLKNYGLSESHPYNGKKCIIRKGTLITSPQKNDWIIEKMTVIGVIILAIIISIGGGKDSASENYNDNSTTHQILAKNYFKDYLKDNLKNAKSYEEVNYTSSYNYSKGCYEVTLKYRATNSFGALVLEQASGDVYFSDNTVSIKNVKTE